MPSTSTLIPYEISGYELTLRVGDDAFKPTRTTQKLANAADLPSGMSVLDLGCGVAPLAICAALKGAAPVYALDVMATACEYARENVERAGVADKVTVLCGDLFEPVEGVKFDIIINDVSGIADRVARLSPWYPEPIPTGGADGANVVLRVLSEAPEHLNPGGCLYFATSTLSDVDRIVNHARSIYGNRLERLASVRFPFSPELIEAIDELEVLRDEGVISFESRRSRHIWTLDLFRASVDWV